MEKITEKIAAVPPDQSYFSLEFFPPKTEMVGNSRTSRIPKADNIVGSAKPHGSLVSHGKGASPFVRDCDMGSWR